MGRGGFLTIWFLLLVDRNGAGFSSRVTERSTGDGLEAAAAHRAAGDVVRDKDGVALAGHDRFSVDALEERGRGVVVALEP